MSRYKVIEELPGGGETIHRRDLTQQQAADFCSELSDEWEGENAPEDPDEYEAWREVNCSPFWYTEDVE